jgi:hypothetical protein
VLLSRQWQAVRDKLPADHQAKFEHRAPNLTDVRDAMSDVEQRYDRKCKSGVLGKMGVQYRRAYTSIQSHQIMLQIIPQGNEYVSLFSGVLVSVVSASDSELMHQDAHLLKSSPRPRQDTGKSLQGFLTSLPILVRRLPCAVKPWISTGPRISKAGS